MKLKKLKKISLLVLILVISLFVCGCGKEEETATDITGTTTVKQSIVDDEFNENGTGTLKCSTEAVADEGIDVDLSYTLKYKNGNILELTSIQKVTSDDSDSLDLYENAYVNIANNYKNLNHYDTEVIRDGNTVTYTAVINYEEIDIKKLLNIEGEEDNIIKNGKAKLSLWLDLAGKIGTTCEEV